MKRGDLRLLGVVAGLCALFLPVERGFAQFPFSAPETGSREAVSERLGFEVRLPRWLPPGLSIQSIAYVPPRAFPVMSVGRKDTEEGWYRRPPGVVAYGFIVQRFLDGYRVQHVAAGSPAAAAGLRPGDLIVRGSGVQLQGGMGSVTVPGGRVGGVGTVWVKRGDRVDRLVMRLRPWRPGKARMRWAAWAPRARINFRSVPMSQLNEFSFWMEEWRTDAGFVDTLALAKPRTVRAGGRVYTIFESALRQTVVQWTSNGIRFELTCQPFGNARVPTDLLLRIAGSVPD